MNSMTSQSGQSNHKMNSAIEQNGGASHMRVFNNSSVVYMIADATEKGFIQRYKQRLDKIGLPKQEQQKSKPHITMMEVIVNKNNPYSYLILDVNNRIINALEKLLRFGYQQLSPQIYLTSQIGKYEIMGEYMAKVYTSNNSIYITNFRMILYKYLEKLLGKGKRSIKKISGLSYYVYSYHNMELIAVPEYYHGKGIWKPHLSLVKLNKIKKYNPRLYAKYKSYGINPLIDALSGVGGSINNLNMSYHFGNLRISVI
jgi:hypothetical protein